MELKKFRFKKEFFLIDGKFNVPALIICSGNGYNFKTYCCKECGEIFVVEPESFCKQNLIAKEIIDKNCPKCDANLKKCLVDYPENIFYENKILINKNKIDKYLFENTEIMEVYLLKMCKS